MSDDDAAKADLRDYLQQGRDAILWKLEGLSEYDVRRPLTPTATNLLGLVRHVSFAETGWFGPVFGRTIDGPRWDDDDLAADPHLDMWVPVELTRADLLDGAAGLRRDVDNLPEEPDWARHHARVEAAARAAAAHAQE